MCLAISVKLLGLTESKLCKRVCVQEFCYQFLDTILTDLYTEYSPANQLNKLSHLCLFHCFTDFICRVENHEMRSKLLFFLFQLLPAAPDDLETGKELVQNRPTHCFRNPTFDP